MMACRRVVLLLGDAGAEDGATRALSAALRAEVLAACADAPDLDCVSHVRARATRPVRVTLCVTLSVFGTLVCRNWCCVFGIDVCTSMRVERGGACDTHARAYRRRPRRSLRHMMRAAARM